MTTNWIPVYTTDALAPGPTGWVETDPDRPPRRIRGRRRGPTGGRGLMRDYTLTGEQAPDGLGLVYAPDPDRRGGHGATLLPRFDAHGRERVPPTT